MTAVHGSTRCLVGDDTSHLNSSGTTTEQTTKTGCCSLSGGVYSWLRLQGNLLPDGF